MKKVILLVLITCVFTAYEEVKAKIGELFGAVEPKFLGFVKVEDISSYIFENIKENDSKTLEMLERNFGEQFPYFKAYLEESFYTTFYDHYVVDFNNSRDKLSLSFFMLFETENGEGNLFNIGKIVVKLSDEFLNILRFKKITQEIEGGLLNTAKYLLYRALLKKLK